MKKKIFLLSIFVFVLSCIIGIPQATADLDSEAEAEAAVEAVAAGVAVDGGENSEHNKTGSSPIVDHDDAEAAGNEGR